MLSVLIDTNIALDHALNRAEWSNPAKRIFDASAKGAIRVVFSAGSLKDVYYIATKSAGKDIALRIVRFLLTVCEIAPITHETYLQALEEDEPDYEDALVAAIARENAVDIIISRDRDAFNNACAPKIDSQQFVDFFLNANPKALFFELDGDDMRGLENPNA